MQARLALEHGKKVFLVRSLVTDQEWARDYVARRGAVVVDDVDEVLQHLAAPDRVPAEGTPEPAAFPDAALSRCRHPPYCRPGRRPVSRGAHGARTCGPARRLSAWSAPAGRSRTSRPTPARSAARRWKRTAPAPTGSAAIPVAGSAASTRSRTNRGRCAGSSTATSTKGHATGRESSAGSCSAGWRCTPGALRPDLIVVNPTYTGPGGREFGHAEAVLRKAAGEDVMGRWAFDLGAPPAIVKTRATAQSAAATAKAKRAAAQELRAALVITDVGRTAGRASWSTTMCARRPASSIRSRNACSMTGGPRRSRGWCWRARRGGGRRKPCGRYLPGPGLPGLASHAPVIRHADGSVPVRGACPRCLSAAPVRIACPRGLSAGPVRWACPRGLSAAPVLGA